MANAARPRDHDERVALCAGGPAMALRTVLWFYMVLLVVSIFLSL
jgi:hypothetical protein